MRGEIVKDMGGATNLRRIDLLTAFYVPAP